MTKHDPRAKLIRKRSSPGGMRSYGNGSADRPRPPSAGHHRAWHRRLHAEGFARSLTLEKLSNATGARTIDIGGAIKHLVGLGLIGVKPGSGYVPGMHAGGRWAQSASCSLLVTEEGT